MLCLQNFPASSVSITIGEMRNRIQGNAGNLSPTLERDKDTVEAGKLDKVLFAAEKGRADRSYSPVLIPGVTQHRWGLP